jgi:glycosyltransferase involved in cell wall biosynthesis
MPPVVSVLMTAYNREQFIAEAIESVLAQTFKDFELIIVDDCSSDATVEIARRYAADSRVRVHVNEKNLGDYPNRNRAAKLAQGKYLKYLDSDDVIYPHGVEVMVRSMEEFPEAGLGLCRPDSPDVPYPALASSRDAYLEHFLGNGLLWAGPTATILEASAFRAAGCFSGKRFVGDTEMWLKMAASHPVVKMVSGLVWYRIHAGQELNHMFTNTQPISLNYRISTTALEYARRFLTATEIRAASRRVKHLHARNILSLARRGHRHVAWELYRLSGLSAAELLRGLRRPS